MNFFFKIKSIIGKFGEILIFSLILGIINLFFHNNPGFFTRYLNPYIILGILVSSYYGKRYGYLSLFLSAIVIAILLPLTLEISYPGTWGINYWLSIMEISQIPFIIGIVAVLIFGLIRDSIVYKATHKQKILRLKTDSKGTLVKALEIVNRELEERVSGQNDSISSLYSLVQRLYTLNLEIVLETILEITEKFSAVSQASIWEYKPDSKEMILVKSLGWEKEKKITTIIPVSNSIEGWVARNNMLFSIRLLLQYENLKQMDTGRNLLTLPIPAGRKIWGVLNIEKMSFAKYNLYTEKLLTIVLSLASPSMEKALEFESIIRQAEINAFTNLPSFPSFYTVLEKELKRMQVQKGTLSVIIIELINFHDLEQSFTEKKAFSILGAITELAKSISQNKADTFHYKNDNQMVILFPNLDYDGSSLFCLEILESISKNTWSLDEKDISLEIVLGYASLGDKKISANDILKIAENLLEMQKI